MRKRKETIPERERRAEEKEDGKRWKEETENEWKLEGWLRSFIGVEKGLDEDRALSDVDEESVRRPTANELDERGWDAVFSKRGSATCSHRLTGDIVFEETMKSRDEEIPSWYGPFRREPKGRR